MVIEVSSIKFVPFEKEFRSVIETSTATFERRKGWYIAVHARGGLCGIGEIAPLPEAGTESFRAAEQELQRFTSCENFPPLPTGLDECEDWLNLMGLSSEQMPALCYGMECALVSAMAQAQSRRLDSMLGYCESSRITLCGVAGASHSEEIKRCVQELIANGLQSVKIKVGRRPVRDDIFLLQELRTTHPDLGLRVDANAAWELKDAQQFCSSVLPLNLQFVEDPLRKPTPKSLRELREYGLPVALDEPVRCESDIDLVAEKEMADIVVLKPAAIGSFTHAASMARRALEHRLDVVFSNLYESEIGLTYARILAAVYGSRTLPHGLYPSLTMNSSASKWKSPVFEFENGTSFLTEISALPSMLTLEQYEALGFSDKHIGTL